MADSLLSSICSLCVCCCVNSVVCVSICILSSTSASSSLNFSFVVARRSAGVSDMRDLLVVVSPMVPVCLSVVEMRKP